MAGPGRRAVDLNEIGFVTFGSQLQVLFARAFPAYVNLPAIAWLYWRLGGAWRNLYRDTDYLAGPVLSWGRTGRKVSLGWFGEPPPPTVISPPAGVEGRTQYGSDWRLLDPPIPDAGQRERPLDALRRHSNFWTDDAWPDALREVQETAAIGASPGLSDRRRQSGGG
jgi:hypothetical protein